MAFELTNLIENLVGTKREDIEDPLLDAISAVESSSDTNPARLKKNSQGALGEYQIKEDMFTEVKKFYPDTRDLSFEDAALGPRRREIAKKALDVASRQMASKGFVPTRDDVLAVYNIGIGNYMSGKKLDAAKRYLKKIKTQLGEK